MPLDQQRQDRLKRHAVKRIVRVVVHSAKNLAIQQASIHRHRRIDINRPQVNSTCEASDIVESCLTQNFSDFETSHSLMTMNNDGRRFMFPKRIDMLRKRLHRDMNRTCDLCEISLGNRAAIDQHNDLTSSAAAMKISRRDFPFGVEWIAAGKAVFAWIIGQVCHCSQDSSEQTLSQINLDTSHDTACNLRQSQPKFVTSPQSLRLNSPACAPVRLLSFPQP